MTIEEELTRCYRFVVEFKAENGAWVLSATNKEGKTIHYSGQPKHVLAMLTIGVTKIRLADGETFTLTLKTPLFSED